jgi:hypothetical protein
MLGLFTVSFLGLECVIGRLNKCLTLHFDGRSFGPAIAVHILVLF